MGCEGRGVERLGVDRKRQVGRGCWDGRRGEGRVGKG